MVIFIFYKKRSIKELKSTNIDFTFYGKGQ